MKGIRALVYFDAIFFLFIAAAGVVYIFFEKYSQLSIRYTLSLIFPKILLISIAIFIIVAITAIVLFFTKAMRIESENNVEATPASDLVILKKIELDKTQDKIKVGDIKSFDE